MKIVPIYDRSELIRRAIDNVTETLIEVILTVVFIVLLFLWHVPSALIPVITIPVAVLVSFIPFRMLGHHGEHHVARRHRDRDGRAGGRGDRRRRADAQEARGAQRGRARRSTTRR